MPNVCSRGSRSGRQRPHACVGVLRALLLAPLASLRSDWLLKRAVEVSECSEHLREVLAGDHIGKPPYLFAAAEAEWTRSGQVEMPLSAALLHAAAYSSGCNDSAEPLGLYLVRQAFANNGCFRRHHERLRAGQRAVAILASETLNGAEELYQKIGRIDRLRGAFLRSVIRRQLAGVGADGGSGCAHLLSQDDLDADDRHDGPTDDGSAPPEVELPRVVLCKRPLHDGSLPRTDVERFRQSYNWLSEPLPFAAIDVDADAFERDMLAEFPWMTALIRLEAMDIRRARVAGRRETVLRPRLVYGPPGCGKTAYVRRRSAWLAMPLVIQRAGSDDRSLSGTSAGWGSANPSLPVRMLREHRVANPAIAVDEIDKVDSSERKNGNIMDALLPFLEKENSRAYHDECLSATVDLSYVSWTLLANNVGGIHAPLIDRMQVIEVNRPAADHVPALVHRIARDLAAEWEVPPALMQVPHEAMPLLIRHFSRCGGSIRSLKRAVETVVTVADPLPN